MCVTLCAKHFSSVNSEYRLVNLHNCPQIRFLLRRQLKNDINMYARFGSPVTCADIGERGIGRRQTSGRPVIHSTLSACPE